MTISKIIVWLIIGALVGSLLCVGARWLIRKRAAPKTPEVKP
jgi:hypothetical protein